ncbi:hypothetical protein Smp_178320 [Schistosoma mansoni]|uniref:hypothetical protein n=1 Tax=Schistosoma mansoni TaxID=6183 RepID=UPI00022C8231|nr:hypothetical protein Smp_178320 [Schistosoma mansoni]|eukprot:XP_018644447.1 hypothetical protein Smp_178320 [Schistosoma mansoni]
MNYWSFIRNFEEYLDDSVGFRFRSNYLVQYCDGEAKATIVHYALLEPEGGYCKAFALLEEAFGQKHIAVHAFIDKRLNIPAIKDTDPGNLKRLSHEIQTCELTLRRKNSSKTTETKLLKLPLHLQRERLKVACQIFRGD